MDAHGGVQVGVGRAQDHAHGPARRHAGDEDPARVDVIGGRDLARQTGQERGLARAPLLILAPEPIPALAHIGGGGLRGIDDEEGVDLGQRIHRRVRGKIVGVLETAMEHDDER